MTSSDRILRDALLDRGVEEKKLPEMLRDREIARSRTGKLGSVSVWKYKGVKDGPAPKILRELEKKAGGTAKVLEVLAATGGTPALLEVAKKGVGQKSLARLVAEAGITPDSVLTGYSKGLLMLGQLAAIAEAAEALPRVAKQLVRMALPLDEVCHGCFGNGVVPRQQNANKGTVPCPVCRGKKVVREESPLQEFAIKQLNEMGGLTAQRAPLIQVNKQEANIQVQGEGLLSSRILEMSDRLLLSSGKQPSAPPSQEPAEEPIEAELVPSTDSPESDV